MPLSRFLGLTQRKKQLLLLLFLLLFLLLLQPQTTQTYSLFIHKHIYVNNHRHLCQMDLPLSLSSSRRESSSGSNSCVFLSTLSCFSPKAWSHLFTTLPQSTYVYTQISELHIFPHHFCRLKNLNFPAISKQEMDVI